MTLSVVLITKNEEAWVQNCLESVKAIASEIIVVDCGSTDQTLEICKKHDCKIFSRDWAGFSVQKNFAATKATSDWLFFIDADERISAKLKEEIKQILSRGDDGTSYFVPRQNIILGKKMRHGGWWPDFVLRLVHRHNFIHWSGELHEQMEVKANKANLSGPLYHLSHRGMTWMLNKSIRYTQTEAKLRYQAGHPPVTWWRIIRVMVTEFFYRFFQTQGFRDGMVGFIESVSQSYNMFLIYEQLWEMQKGQTMEELYQKIDKELANNGFQKLRT